MTARPPSSAPSLRLEPAPARLGRAAGPAVLVVPLLLFAVSVVWLATARPKRGGDAGPAPEVAIATVEGWTGSSAEDATPRVAARLTRLHADPRRQAFESAALARRLGLPAGEPFRLELHVLGASDAGALEALPLTELAVRDRRGVALASLPPLVPPADDAVADPLAVLLDVPDALAPGVTVALVLWGRVPEAEARVVGCGPSEVELEPRALAWRGVDEALARLERAPAAEAAPEHDGR